MDGRPHPSPNAFYPFSVFTTGEWQGDTLTAYTTHMKTSVLRRANGVPKSDQATATIHITRHDDLLTIVTIEEDPVYLTEPLVQSQNFVLVSNVTPATYQQWTVCLPQEEIAGRPRGFVPHYLPGENPYVREYATRFHLPFDATRAGAVSMCPEYQIILQQMLRAMPPAEAAK